MSARGDLIKNHGTSLLLKMDPVFRKTFPIGNCLWRLFQRATSSNTCRLRHTSIQATKPGAHHFRRTCVHRAPILQSRPPNKWTSRSRHVPFRSIIKSRADTGRGGDCNLFLGGVRPHVRRRVMFSWYEASVFALRDAGRRSEIRAPACARARRRDAPEAAGVGRGVGFNREWNSAGRRKSGAGFPRAS